MRGRLAGTRAPRHGLPREQGHYPRITRKAGNFMGRSRFGCRREEGETITGSEGGNRNPPGLSARVIAREGGKRMAEELSAVVADALEHAKSAGLRYVNVTHLERGIQPAEERQGLPLRRPRRHGRSGTRPSSRASASSRSRRRGPTCGSARRRSATSRRSAATRAGASSTAITPTGATVRDETKYGQLIAFGRALPAIRRARQPRPGGARACRARRCSPPSSSCSRRTHDPRRQRGVRAREPARSA